MGMRGVVLHSIALGGAAVRPDRRYNPDIDELKKLLPGNAS